MHITVLSNTKCFLLSAMVVMTAAAQPAFAQSSEPLSGVYACQSVADKDAQLACFLAETAKLRGGDNSNDVSVVEENKVIPVELNAITPLQKKNVIAVEKDNSVEKMPVDESKKFIPLKKDKAFKKRTLAIRKTETYGSNGFIRFTLENGEIWKQTGSGRFRIGKGDPEDTLVIISASMGSSFGRVNDKSPTLRIKRIR